MDKESKGIAWFGNFYRKLETVLSEVDNFASQNCIKVSGQGSITPKKSNDAQGLIFDRDEPKEVMENCSSGAIDMQQDHDDLALPSCIDPLEPPSDENMEISESTLSDVRVDGSGSDEKLSDNVLLSDEQTLLKASVLEEYIGNNNQTATTSLYPAVPRSLQDGSESNIVHSAGHSWVDSNLVHLATEIAPLLVEDNMAKMRPTGGKSITFIGNLDDLCNDEHEAAPLETIELYDVANREDLSDINDSMLYAVSRRTRKLRSFKKRIVDTLTPKRQREKEYEQLAIWFGDASMGSDQDDAGVLPSKTATVIDTDTKTPLPSEDSEWELL